MEDRELASDQARRAAGHEEVKAQIGGDIERAIVRQADVSAPGDRGRIEQVAAQLREKAVSEVATSERQIGVARVFARVSQIVGFAFCVVYALLTMRFVLALVAARSGAGFVRLLVAISDPFYAPFRGIVTGADLGAGHVVAMSFVFALGVYLVTHLGVHQLLRLLGRPASV